MNAKPQTGNKTADGLIDDANELLSATADSTGEKIVEARKRLESGLVKAKEAAAYAKERAAEGCKATEQYVRDNPYKAAGIALGVGALLGALLFTSRRS